MERDIGRRNWILIWVLGMAGQICWNVENSWFSTFVYNKVAPDPAIINGVSGMVPTPSLFIVSAAVTALTILPLLVANRLHQSRVAAKAAEPLNMEG